MKFRPSTRFDQEGQTCVARNIIVYGSDEDRSNCWSVFDSRVLTISSDLPTVLQVLNEVVPNLEEVSVATRRGSHGKRNDSIVRLFTCIFLL